MKNSVQGVNGTWILSGYNNVYWSTARDAAGFGYHIKQRKMEFEHSFCS